MYSYPPLQKAHLDQKLRHYLQLPERDVKDPITDKFNPTFYRSVDTQDMLNDLSKKYIYKKHAKDLVGYFDIYCKIFFTNPQLISFLVFDSGGFVYLNPNMFPQAFAQDIDVAQAKVMAAAQKPYSQSILTEISGPPAWKQLPSWYQISENDHYSLIIWDII